MFKVSLKTFGSDIVYKYPKLDEQVKATKFSIGIFGKGIFDKISLFFLELLSNAFPGLKPCRVSIGTTKIGKMFAARHKIERFLFNETQAFLRKQNKDISVEGLRSSIHEMMSRKDLDKEIELPLLLKEIHNKHLFDFNLMQRNLYIQLHDYIKDLPGQDKELKLFPFSVSEEGIVNSSHLKNEFPMHLQLNPQKDKVLIGTSQFREDLPCHVQTLLGNFEWNKTHLFTPAAIANKLNEMIASNVKHEYKQFLSSDSQLPTPTSETEISLNLEGKQMDLGMHKINLNGNHYIASSMWFYENAPYFWTSVFEQHPPVIVKLTDDRPTEETPLYWPNDVGQTWSSSNSNIASVTCISKENLNKNLIKRVFEVKKGDAAIQVTHLDYLGWPDKSTPKKSAFNKLINEVETICPNTSLNNPILVHCMGGIGRTGTFIAAHSSKKTPIENRSEKMYYDIVMDLRRQRPYRMVETPDQYHFIRQIANMN